MFSNLKCKNLLLLVALLALVVGSATPAMAGRNGIYWYINQTTVTVTLVNLTDYTLTTTDKSVTTGGASCTAYPFQHGTVSVPPYGTSSWKTDITANIAWYSGTITFLPSGKDAKWAFNLAFSPDYIGYFKQYGTWVYLEPASTVVSYDYVHNVYAPWYPSWVNTNLEIQDQVLTEYPASFGRWTTPLLDTHMHNQMNLLGYELSVSVFTGVGTSGGNGDITLVVQQTGADAATDVPPWDYVGWKLNWVDNDGNDFP